MAGVTFDPSEFAAFKARSAPPAPAGGDDSNDDVPAPVAAPAGGGVAFDPAEFAAFKAATKPASGRAVKNPPVPAGNPFVDDGSAAPQDGGSGPPGSPEGLSFNARFGSGPMARSADTSSPLGQALQTRADERLVGKPSTENAVDAAIFNAANAYGLSLPRNFNAFVEAVRSGKSFNEAYQYVKDTEDALSRQNPKAGLAGTVGGIGAGMAVLPAWEGGASLLARMGKAAATAGGYSAAGEYADTKDVGDALKAGAIGGAIGGALQPVAEKAVPVITGMIAKGLKIRNDSGELTTTAKALLAREGIDPASLPADFERQIQTTFAAKGETPAALREAQAGEFGIPLSTGQATGDDAALGLERSALGGTRGAKAQGVAQDFDAKQATAIEQARQGLGTRVGDGAPYENPQATAEAVADRAREAYGRTAAAADAQEAAAQEALATVRGPAPPDAVDAAGGVGSGLRDKATQSKSAYQQAYADMAAIPGTFQPGALDRMGQRVSDRLGVEYPIDPQLTPAATRAMKDLGDLPTLLGTPDGAGPTLSGVDQVRKRLVSLYGSTKANPTDRRAMGKILSEFDSHVHDAIGSGLFGDNTPFPGSALIGRAGSPVAGAATSDAASGVAAGGASQREPESLSPFLGRMGGVAADGDARAADLQRIQTGYGPLARRNGRSMDDLRNALADEGFIARDPDGAISRNITDELHGLIQQERQGSKVYRAQDQARASTLDPGGRLADSSAAYGQRVQAHADQVARELQGAGYTARDLDPVTLQRAGESIARGEHSDPFAAYEAAALQGGQRVAPAAGSDVPFPSTFLAQPVDQSAEAADAMHRARALFALHQRTFKSQGAGDDVGRAMQQIVDRTAEPVETARLLYGGNPGLNIRMADRVKAVVGAKSDDWWLHQQGYISSVVNGRDMSPKAIAARVQDALEGPKRQLTHTVLGPEQIAGLQTFQRGVQAAQGTRGQVPDWLATLGRTDFDPNKIMGDLFGSGVPGARVGSGQYAKALKGMLGEASPEWAALRRATWERLTTGPNGSALPPRQMAERITAFVSGPGRRLGEAMFAPAEMAEMRRFGTAIQATVRPDGKELPTGKAHAIAGKAFDALAAMIGLKTGGIGGAAAAYGARRGQKYLQEGRAARAVQRSLQGGAPKERVSLPPPDLRPLSRGVGLVANTYQ